MLLTYVKCSYHKAKQDKNEEEMHIKKHEGDGYVCYLDYGDGIPGIFIYSNSFNRFLFINYISIKKESKKNRHLNNQCS